MRTILFKAAGRYEYLQYSVEPEEIPSSVTGGDTSDESYRS
jgi:hypothetical protein